jgi:hypothetical protein
MQVLVMLGLWVALHGIHGPRFSSRPGLKTVAELAEDGSALSFNTVPLLSAAWAGRGDFWVGLVCAAGGMFFSAVFIHLHFRRVLWRPAR